MHTKINKILFIKWFTMMVLIVSFFSFIQIGHASASTFQLSGVVTDSSSNGIVGATVDVININNNVNVASTVTDSSGNYITNVDPGTYDIQVTPPLNSGFSSAIAFG